MEDTANNFQEIAILVQTDSSCEIKKKQNKKIAYTIE